MAPPRNLALTFDDEFNSLSLRNGGSGTWSPAFDYSSNGSSSDTLSSWQVNPSWGPTSGVDTNVFSTDNGVLSIATKPTPGNVGSAVDNKPFLGGQLITANSFSQTYGYFEMNAKLSSAAGSVSAFWLLPADGSWPPELDTTEVLGSDPTTLVMTSHSSGGTVPQWTNIPNASQGFHTYGVDWEPDKLTWYFDDKQVAQQNTPADMNKPMYMLLSNLTGTSNTWTGAPNPGETGNMQVNYVRAYSSNPNAAAVTPDNSTPDTSTPASPASTSGTPAATGTDTLHLSISENAWQGDAQFSIAIDGKTIGNPLTATALHSDGASQDFSFSQALTAGTHDLAVSFLNDAYGGSDATDRNLYIDSVGVNDTPVSGAMAALLSNSTQHFQITVPSHS